MSIQSQLREREREVGMMRSFASLPLYRPPVVVPHVLSSKSLSLFTTTRIRPLNHAKKMRPTTHVVMAKGNSNTPNSSKKSILSNLIQEIEPLDVSLIQKDVPPDTVDAMKRTISGMLGLLPSDHFQVLIESLWDPLSKLLLSSMKTGYTLRNAEYRLCLERNLDMHEENFEKQKPENTRIDAHRMLADGNTTVFESGKYELLPKPAKKEEHLTCENVDIQGLGKMTPEAKQYVLHLQSSLSSVRKELHEIKRKNAALQMQQFVGEEKNDLLDYLRSLQPEKVAELSEPTSPELQETIHCVVHGLLATLSPKMHSKVPILSENMGTLNVRKEEESAELVENTSLQFQPLLSVTRDYLARLLFWCMLLGHYLRGLEYRLELMELLTLSHHMEPNDACDDEQVA